MDNNLVAIFEIKIFRKIYGLCKDVNTGKWRIWKIRNLKRFIKSQVF